MFKQSVIFHLCSSLQIAPVPKPAPAAMPEVVEEEKDDLDKTIDEVHHLVVV